MKQCTKCKETKNELKFGKDKGTKDKLRFWCKGCVKKDYWDHRESRLEQSKRYWQKNTKKKEKKY